MSEQNIPNHPGTTFKLRIELVHESVSPSLLQKFSWNNRLGQSQPVKIGLRITNIGECVFPGSYISNFRINSTTEGIFTNSDGTYFIKTINPGENTEIDIDKITLIYKGSAWVSLSLSSVEGGGPIQTYQFDCNHKKDNAYSKLNEWGNSLFIQGEMEILQHKTNMLLSALTILMVWESIFGLKNSLLKVLSATGAAASWIGNLLGRIAR